MVIPNYGFGVYFGLAILFMCHPNSLFAMGCLSPNPHASLYSNCLSGAKASDIKLWLSLVRLKKWSPWVLIGNQMPSWSTMHQCIIAYSHFFHLMKLFYPKFTFVWTLYNWKNFSYVLTRISCRKKWYGLVFITSSSSHVTPCVWWHIIIQLEFCEKMKCWNLHYLIHILFIIRWGFPISRPLQVTIDCCIRDFAICKMRLFDGTNFLRLVPNFWICKTTNLKFMSNVIGCKHC